MTYLFCARMVYNNMQNISLAQLKYLQQYYKTYDIMNMPKNNLKCWHGFFTMPLVLP
jgi:hypothetical protein